MIGININDRTQNFTGQILTGEKTVETRKTHSLRPYVGKRVGIVRTGKGPAQLVGYVDVVAEISYPTPGAFESDFERHRVAPGSEYFKSAGFGYVLENVRTIRPVPVTSLGIVGRQVPAEKFPASRSAKSAKSPRRFSAR